LAYLLRYETLVRSQDVEDVATSDHLRPLFDRLVVLGGGDGGGGASGGASTAATDAGKADADIPGLIPTHSASTDEGDWTTAAAAAGGASAGETTNTSDECVLTYKAMEVALTKLDADASMVSADAKYSNGGASPEAEVLTTDRQCLLLLRTIVDAHNDNGSHGNDNDGNPAGGLTYAEFLQVYKVVVGGMQTLQRLPKKEADNTSSSAATSTNGRRLQIRQRTLDLVRLFGPAGAGTAGAANERSSNTAHAHADDASCSSSVSSLPSLPGKLNRHLHKKARRGMATRSSTGNGGGGASTTSSNNRGGGSSKYRDPTDLPRDSTFSTLSLGSVASTITDADDVRRVLTIKDRTVRNLLSDHAGEMDDLTEKMVDLSRKSRRRKTRMGLWAVAMGVLGLSIGLFVGGGGSSGGSGNHGQGSRSSSTTGPPTPTSTSSAPSASSSSSPSAQHQPDLLLANELKYTKRELGQVNARVSKLQKRLVDAESDAKAATAQLYGCRSDLTAAGRDVDDLKVEAALGRDEIEACQAARTRDQSRARVMAATAAAASGATVPAPSTRTSTAASAVPVVMKQASSVMAGASGAVLFPYIAKAVASGSIRVLAAAGGGLWTGVGLLVGAIISGAIPSLFNRKE